MLTPCACAAPNSAILVHSREGRRKFRMKKIKSVSREPGVKHSPAVPPQKPKSLLAHPELPGLALLLCAVAFTAYFAAPEMRICRVPLNDLVFHLAASERMETSFERGEPFLDPWVSEWALGYPVWRSYQPVGHVAGAIAIHLFRPFADPATTFAVLFYLLLATLPISVYVGARLFGLSPPAAGLAAVLLFAASADGDPGRYGLSYGSVLWRGSGLYTQLFALHFLVLSMGLVAKALDNASRGRRTRAALMLALTALTHIIFGYAAFVSAALLAVAGPQGRRAQRLVRLVSIAIPALLLFSWFLIPLIGSALIVNHSRWEDAAKWDSYGATFVLRELLSGRLLDFGRLPVLSLLAAIGAAAAAFSYRDDKAKRLLALCALWLALVLGRETWGGLVVLAGVPADLHMHRLEAVFELSAVLLAAFGLTRLVHLAAKRSRTLAPIAVAAIAAAVLYMGVDRAGYLEQNRLWGEQNLAAYQAEQGDLEAAFSDARSILGARPGRVSAGMPANWGNNFKIGSVPVWAFLSRDHFDQPSFLYHSMSKTSDIMVLRDESSFAHDVVFGIRAVVAPADLPMPAYMQKRSVHGRLAVYEASPEGYFGVVDVIAHYAGPASTDYEPSAAWLKSAMMTWGRVVSLDPRVPAGPAIGRWEALPNPTAGQEGLRGTILAESKVDETYQASIDVNRPAYAFLKITWSPDLAATVDGQPAPVVHVTPGFCAVPISAGRHDVVVRYRPGPLKAVLFLASICAFALICFAFGTRRFAEMEEAATARLASVGQRLATPRAAVAGALLLASIVALHPLFRGKLISGHDATAYPPRVVEMAQALTDGHIPPIWAPDLSSGHGQPLFEFLSPLPYWIALPFRALGFGLTDSLQLSLALLCLLGAWAVYGIGRHFQAPRYASLGGAIAWLFSPYLCLDLFVRADFAEATAVAVAPIALLALLRAMKRPGALRIGLAAGAVALIQLAHSMAALLLVPVYSLVVLVYGIAALRAENPSPSPRRLARFAPLMAGAAAIALAMALAAYFWIPSLAELSNLHQGRLTAPEMSWSAHILSPYQLLWSPWGFGYSVPGPKDGMSFALGLAHLALGVAGFVIVLRCRGKLSGDRGERALLVAFGVIAAAGALLTTYWTSWLWSQIHLLQLLQFPWRALMIPGLLLPLLAIFALKRAGFRWTVVLVALLAAINLPHTEPSGYLTYDDEYYYPKSLATLGINVTTGEAFEPRWSDARPPYSPNPLIGRSGPIEVTEISRRTARQEFRVNAPQVTVVESSTFYYPGWTVTIDGAAAGVNPMPVRGTMLFAVPAGQHKVYIELRLTPVRKDALLVTLLALLSFGVSIAVEWLRT